MNGSTRNPGESSVYSFNMVLEDPPAPAARLELGFFSTVAAAAPARRRIAAVCAPGGFATPDEARETAAGRAESESDMMVG